MAEHNYTVTRVSRSALLTEGDDMHGASTSTQGAAARRRTRAQARAFALVVLAGTALVGCAKGEIMVGGGSGGGAGAGGGTAPGAGGTIGITIATTPSSLPSSSADAVVITQRVGCDGGDGCTCPPFNLAVLGKPGKWGANPNGDPDTALQEWLNSSSAGTARADNFTNRVTLTADFLATYNVIILASLSDDSNLGPFWTFTDAEAAAFRTWIENGGGVITLTGYSGIGDEIRPVNQLIGFSGVTYNNDSTWGGCTDWRICGCAHSNTLSDWSRSDPLIANLSTGVTLIGYQNGRSITVPADGHVAATVDSGKNALVGKLVGKGRVLAYGDEWITYTSQWTGVGNPSANDPSCQGYLPQDKYQMAQFWYNMIRWSQPGADCFTIVDTYNPITIW